uniref:ATP synthase F0 subunit 8 n=1 Tax=Amblyomma dissimile TaxID=251381 RepID=UPI002E780633|nr:ATP synthase F0 subunit 8 [Amblyomma dissimile]WQF68955.1 ATP synthase F0 subunit 8 [Amblyomma dissimile]
MPQLFPMNWLFISIMILIMLIYLIMIIYFFKISNKINLIMFPDLKKKIFLKW